MTRLVNCPSCGSLVRWSPDHPFRPFCSERCRLLDTAAWASESYRIPGLPATPPEADEEAT
ncbi:MAG: DNA gyrase inhibitor YacG [Casimicrobiaceae bacterium]|nr:DNA gyrase inhibitor YacG [Casimicrobiaceae bacterium]MCX8098488.1 DNA gyrase inhibitor YacG [Casimicrobiaceae bacterium]MDW8311591.1 DNA gyrase inhibitor YacG [Burkholderiales bacterium]